MKIKKSKILLLSTAPALLLAAMGTYVGKEVFGNPKETKAAIVESQIPHTGSLDGWKCTLVENINNLTVNDYVVIAAQGDTQVAMGDQTKNNRSEASVVKEGKTITSFDENKAVSIFQLAEGTVASTFAFRDVTSTADQPKYLYAASSSSNYLKVQSSIDGNASFAITIADGITTIQAQGANTRNLLKYNSSSKIFSCYANGQADPAIYKLERDETEFEVTFVTNGGSTVEAQKVTKGGKITEPKDINRDGWTLMGWYKDSKFKNQWVFETDTVTQDTTLYAEWIDEEMTEYTLDIDLNGGIDDGVSYTAKKAFKEHYFDKLPNPTKAGDSINAYTFEGWYEKDENGYKTDVVFDFDVCATKNVKIYAKWSSTYLITSAFAENITKANLSFDYKKTVSGEGGNASFEKSSSGWVLENNGVTLDISEPSNYKSYPEIRIYKDGPLTITSSKGNIKQIVFTCLLEKGGPGNFTADVGDYSASGNTGTWSGDAASVTFATSTAQVRITKIDVTFGAGTAYTDFSNVKMQFRYDMDRELNTQASVSTERGIYVTDDPEFIFTKKKELTVKTAGKVGKKYINEKSENDTSSYTVGIAIPKGHYNDVLRAAAYVVVDDNYYFNKKKEYSVYTMLDTYISDPSGLSEEQLGAIKAFKAEIEPIKE